jgi:hypothetical protein
MDRHTITRTLEPIRDAALPWIYAVLIFNVLDMVFTVYYIEAGHAVEANPLMAVAYEASPLHFGVVKMALAALGITLLYRARHARSAQLAIRGVAFAYGLLVGYHVVHFPVQELQGLLLGLM